MILVNNPGSWDHVYAPLAHAEWHGWTPTDLIFPFFLFIVGVAVPLAFTKRRARGQSRGRLTLHVLKRSAILFTLGLFMAAFPYFELSGIRIMGVLQRIALVYLAASLLYLTVGSRLRWGLAAGLLVAYWILLSWVPVPGYGAGDLSPEGNLAAYVDRWALGGHLWRDNWDPEGLLSTLPALVTALFGVATGEWLLSPLRDGGKLAGMVAGGAAGVVGGLVWGVWFPINKSLWTSSYVLLTGGIALLVLTLLYWLVDVRGWRSWCMPLVIYGLNAIAVFVASGLVAKSLGLIRLGERGHVVSAKAWIYERLFASWAGPLNGSLAFAVAYVLVWLGLMWVLHARRIYVKI
jgi:predicted acyltransferase